MLLDNPKLVPQTVLPPAGTEGQITFVDGIGLHQYIGGVWTIIGGGEGSAAIVVPLAQTEITSTQTTIYTEVTGNKTVSEVTLVTRDAGSVITLAVVSGGETYYIFNKAYFDAYLTTIIDFKIPLAAGDQLIAFTSEGPDVTITVTGTVTSGEMLIVKTNLNGTASLYTAPSGKTITNLIVCNNAEEMATVTMDIRRADNSSISSSFFNELQLQPGEVVLGDVNTAIDTGATISGTSNLPVTILITA